MPDNAQDRFVWTDDYGPGTDFGPQPFIEKRDEFDYGGELRHGWLQIHLVRRTVIQRLRTAAMWNLGAPVVVSVVSAFIPPPLGVHLQAVNRASTT